MKKLISTSFLLGLCFSVFICCGDEATQTNVESATKLITDGSWDIQRVTIDDVDRTSSFNRLTLEFTGKNYSSSNGHVVWPESGSWSFSDNDVSSILRSDGVLITVEELSEHMLTLSLDWEQNTFNGRIESIKGRHKFMFAR